MYSCARVHGMGTKHRIRMYKAIGDRHFAHSLRGGGKKGGQRLKGNPLVYAYVNLSQRDALDGGQD